MKILSITQVRHAKTRGTRNIRYIWKVRLILFYLHSGFALSDPNGWVSGKKSLTSSCLWKHVIWLKALAFLSLISNEEAKHVHETKRVNSTAIEHHLGVSSCMVTNFPPRLHPFSRGPITHKPWPSSSPATSVSINNFGSEKREWITTYHSGVMEQGTQGSTGHISCNTS